MKTEDTISKLSESDISNISKTQIDSFKTSDSKKSI